MGLPAVMGLVVEEMRHQQPLFGGYLAIGRTAEPGQILGEPGVVDLVGPARDGGIGLIALGPERREILDHAGALLDRGGWPFPAVKARHPALVAPQDVRQSAVDRSPKCAVRLASLGIG